MADRLTQLQDAVDQVCFFDVVSLPVIDRNQLANQFVASLYYINRHHDLQTLSATDNVRQEKKSEGEQDPREKEGINF
jgi:mediator of RNA polymerase II transcription subunit 21